MGRLYPAPVPVPIQELSSSVGPGNLVCSMNQKIDVIVKAFGGLRAHIDQFPLRVELPAGARLADLLSRLAEDQPALYSELRDGLARGYVNILIDGRNARFLAGLDTELKDGASVAFIPPVGGG